jgi:hypothetical protein
VLLLISEAAVITFIARTLKISVHEGIILYVVLYGFRIWYWLWWKNVNWKAECSGKYLGLRETEELSNILYVQSVFLYLAVVNRMCSPPTEMGLIGLGAADFPGRGGGGPKIRIWTYI